MKFRYNIEHNKRIDQHEEIMENKYKKALRPYEDQFASYGCKLVFCVTRGNRHVENVETVNNHILYGNGYRCRMGCAVERDGEIVETAGFGKKPVPLRADWTVTAIGRSFFHVMAELRIEAEEDFLSHEISFFLKELERKYGDEDDNI